MLDIFRRAFLPATIAGYYRRHAIFDFDVAVIFPPAIFTPIFAACRQAYQRYTTGEACQEYQKCAAIADRRQID